MNTPIASREATPRDVYLMVQHHVDTQFNLHAVNKYSNASCKDARNAKDKTYVRKRCSHTGKIKWNTYRKAAAAKRRMDDESLNIYRCNACHSFHLGHGDMYRGRKDYAALARDFFESRRSKSGSKEYCPKAEVDGDGWAWSFGTGMTRHLWNGGRPVCGSEFTCRPSFYYDLDAEEHEADCPMCRLRHTFGNGCSLNASIILTARETKKG